MNLRLLKALVIFMGVLIVLGIMAVGYGLYLKAGGGKTPAPVSATARTAGPAELDVKLAPGESIIDVSYPSDRIALRLARPDGAERILLIDAGTGEILSTIRIERTGP